MVDEALLKILVCPEDKTALTVADEAVVGRINAAIDAGTATNRAGEKVEQRIDGGLIREDGQYLYPILDDIPIMIIDEAIPLAGYAQA